MNLKSRKIKFGSDEDSLIISGLKPSRQFIPDWYKKAVPFSGSGKPEIRLNYSNKALKLCMPFLDSMQTGYIVELWQDVEVIRGEDGSFEIAWPTQPEVLTSRPTEAASTLPIPAGYMDTHFIWNTPVSIETPPGYSILVTHPLNRHDLPFITLSGVVDTDVNPMGKGSLPFFLREDFVGIIPKGTPIFQVIPFKRESWVSEEDKEMHKKANVATRLAKAVTHGFYKNTGWSRKDYS